MNDCWLYDQCNHIDCDKDFCLRKYKLTQLYDKALLSQKQRRKKTLFVDQDQTDLDKFTQLAGIEKDIVNFVLSEDNNLFIHSANSGNGKTSWAIRLLQAYLNNIWYKSKLEAKALFISVPDFLEALKRNISKPDPTAQYILDNILKADLVIWDDIAAKIGTDYEINKLLSFIDSRISLGKANIFTSNLDRDQMYNALGARLTSRICNGAIDIAFSGADKRGLIHNN